MAAPPTLVGLAGAHRNDVGEKRKRPPLTIDEVRALPAAVDFATACRALGIGLTTGRTMLARDAFPVTVHRWGIRAYRVTRASLLELLEGHPTAS